MQTSQVASFLGSLWGRKDEERGFIEIYSGVHKEARLEDRRARHFKTIDGAASEVERLLAAPSPREIYVCVSLAKQPLGKDRRISVEDSIGVCGLFADIDFAGEGKKKAYPPDEISARKVLDATGMKPTLLVHSGGGLQAWWLGEEVAYFDSPEEKARWVRLARGWVDTLQAHAKGMGWAVDPTKDLARLLRVAGTLNNKSAVARPIAVVEEGPRYSDWSAFEALIDWPKQEETQAVVVGGLVLDPHADPRADMFFALSENDRKFKKSWKHERPDLVDQSASAYDMSLAMHAIAAGWSDQDVVNLLIAHRRMHGEDLKLREDYYRRTITRARATCRGGEGEAMKLELGINDPTPKNNQEILAEVSKQLDLHGEHALARVVKLTGDPPTYRLYTIGAATVDLGRIDGIMDQGRFRASVACTTQKLTRTLKRAAWDVLVQAMLAHLEIMDVGDGHPLTRFQVQVEEYLEKNNPVKGEEWREAAQEHKPFFYEEKAWISVKSLVRFCLRTQADKVSDRAVATNLSLSGWEHRRFNFRVEGQQVGRWCWGKGGATA